MSEKYVISYLLTFFGKIMVAKTFITDLGIKRGGT